MHNLTSILVPIHREGHKFVVIFAASLMVQRLERRLAASGETTAH